MSWYSVDELESSFEDTKDFLLPFDLGTWLRVGLIVLFVGGGTSTGFSDFGSIGDGIDADEEFDSSLLDEIRQDMSELGITASGLMFVAVAGIAAVIFLFTYLSAVFEFIFFQAFKDRKPEIRRGLSLHYGNGFKYFLFNVAVLLTWIASFGVIVASVIRFSWQGALVILAMIPLWIGLWLLSFVVRNFALPDIVSNNTSFLQAVRNGIGYARNEWKQTGVFIVLKIFVGIAASIAAGIVYLIALLIVGIPLLIVGIILGIIFLPLGIIVGVVGLVLAIIIWITIQIPVQSFVFQWVYNVFGRFDDQS